MQSGHVGPRVLCMEYVLLTALWNTISFLEIYVSVQVRVVFCLGLARILCVSKPQRKPTAGDAKGNTLNNRHVTVAGLDNSSQVSRLRFSCRVQQSHSGQLLQSLSLDNGKIDQIIDNV